MHRPGKGKMIDVSFDSDRDLLGRLDELAASQGCSREVLINKVIDWFIGGVKEKYGGRFPHRHAADQSPTAKK